MKTLYTAEALATGEGRDGHGRTSDGKLDLDLAIPKEMGGSGNGTNPEQLFAIGYAACYHSALRLVGSSQEKADVSDSAVEALARQLDQRRLEALPWTRMTCRPQPPSAARPSLAGRRRCLEARRGGVDVKLVVTKQLSHLNTGEIAISTEITILPGLGIGARPGSLRDSSPGMNGSRTASEH